MDGFPAAAGGIQHGVLDRQLPGFQPAGAAGQLPDPAQDQEDRPARRGSRSTPRPTGEFLTAEKLFDRYNAMYGPALRATQPRTGTRLPAQLSRPAAGAGAVRHGPVHDPGLVPVAARRISSRRAWSRWRFRRDFPKLMIEQLYTSSPADAPLIKRNLQSGMDIELRRTFELTAVLHVTKLPDGHIQLTVVPINYGRYVFTGTTGGFELQPPTELNVAAGWPVVREDRRETGRSRPTWISARTPGWGRCWLEERRAKNRRDTALKGVDAPDRGAPTPAPSPVAAAPARSPRTATRRAGDRAARKACDGTNCRRRAAASPAPAARAGEPCRVRRGVARG